MRPTVREILADSNIASVAILLLLIRSIESGFRALGQPFVTSVEFLIEMVAIRGIPSYLGSFSLSYWISQLPTLSHFLNAGLNLSAAWVLSCWVFRVGPCRSLIECSAKFARRKND